MRNRLIVAFSDSFSSWTAARLLPEKERKKMYITAASAHHCKLIQWDTGMSWPSSVVTCCYGCNAGSKMNRQIFMQDWFHSLKVNNGVMKSERTEVCGKALHWHRRRRKRESLWKVHFQGDILEYYSHNSFSRWVEGHNVSDIFPALY